MGNVNRSGIVDALHKEQKSRNTVPQNHSSRYQVPYPDH